MTRGQARATLAAAALFAGCGGAQTPARDARAEVAPADIPDPRAAVCAAADAAGVAAAPPFDLIQQIFSDDCTSCHAPGADLDLSPGVASGDLVGAAAPPAESCGGTLVVPGSPDTSYLYQKVSSDHPCAGVRMPRAEFGSDPLPDCVVALIGSWIAAGAPGPAADGGAAD